MAVVAGWVRTSNEDDHFVVAAGGSWVVHTVAELDRRLHGIAPRGARSIIFDLSEVAALDTAGAWLLLRMQRQLAADGRKVVIENLAPSLAPLLQYVAESGGEV